MEKLYTYVWKSLEIVYKKASHVKLENFQVCFISFFLNELNESVRNNGRIGISRNQISRSETCEKHIFTMERDKCAVAAEDDENVSYEKLPGNRVFPFL